MPPSDPRQRHILVGTVSSLLAAGHSPEQIRRLFRGVDDLVLAEAQRRLDARAG